MNARNLTAFLALTVVALASWYLARSLQPTEITETVSNGSTEGFYLKTARILGTDTNGKLLYEIEAEFVEQKESNEIAMQNVQVRYTTDSQVPWIINADTATISEDQKLVRLSGHVIAVSEVGFEGQVTEIRAPHLDIEPTTYRARTDSRVQIRIGSRSLTATGMLALLQENRLQLSSNVSGKFVP
ncbi:MAG: LPS export ABC transporter periplasmic protein LptC [Woeseiaceae bacterium]|nr:LPS export ABC transporter periplasmic protein LptC [Woeseiaceae bacterium]